MSWGQCIYGNHTFCQRQCILLISPPFSGFHSELCQWGRGNAVAIQAPSVLCEDLNSDRQHKTPVCELDNGCPGAKRQNVQLCSNQGCRKHYGTIATLRFVTQPLPRPSFPLKFSSFLSVIPVVQGGKDEGADSVHQNGHSCPLCLVCWASYPAAFHNLSWDTRAPGLQKTLTGLRVSLCWGEQCVQD